MPVTNAKTEALTVEAILDVGSPVYSPTVKPVKPQPANKPAVGGL
jgi:hypothetical protein